jgi:protein transport protein DSL1/ZW10
MLDSIIDDLKGDLLISIITPVLHSHVLYQSRGILVGDAGIRTEKSPSPTSIPEVFDRVIIVLSYLRQKLPAPICLSLSRAILPVISSKLIKFWLTPSMPIDPQGLDTFERVLDCTLQFNETIDGYGWRVQELVFWVTQLPRLWLARRRADSLDQVRHVLFKSPGITKKAERAETELVSSKDEVLLENGPTNDWNASWGHDNEEPSNDHAMTKAVDDDEDVSAWGLDDDTEETKLDSPPSAPKPVGEDDIGDAWGWGDDEQDETADALESVPLAAQTRETGECMKDSPRREITLTEFYTITDIPDSILALIVCQITDSETISQPE